MVATKIVNQQEVIRWMEEGKTYQWIVDEYKRKYNIETVPSLWGNFRRRMGIERRTVRDDELVPWFVQPEHRYLYPVMMLRAEARRRAGKELRGKEAAGLETWKERLAADNLVVHYDPDTEEGFFYVPRREGVDTDLIRVPDRKTKQLPAAD